MLNRRQLAGEAAAKALWARKRLSVPLENALCPIESAESLGIDVRFIDLPSMEGMYVGGVSPRIVLSSLRPQGRRAFTCAHEIGHHAFGHGQQFDEMKDDRKARRLTDPKEFAANCFASYLLMPKAAVESGLSKRGFSYSSLDPSQAYAMASWLGVGYSTFVRHLHYGLRTVREDQALRLLQSKPQSLKKQLTGRSGAGHLHVVDSAWCGRAIDCEVGDFLLAPAGALLEGPGLQALETVGGRALVQALASGIGRMSLASPDWAAFVRVSKHKYVGRSRYRFEEEVPE